MTAVAKVVTPSADRHVSDRAHGKAHGLRRTNFKLMAAGTPYLKKALDVVSSKTYDAGLALSLLKKADDAGSGEAAYAIGTWHLFGKHVKRDYRAAVGYLERATSRGYPSAAYDLAVCHEKGKGVMKDTHYAFSLYMKAARLGDKQAAYEVGRCFYWGIGTSKDARAADVCFEGFDHQLERNVAASIKRPFRRAKSANSR